MRSLFVLMEREKSSRTKTGATAYSVICLISLQCKYTLHFPVGISHRKPLRIVFDL